MNFRSMAFPDKKYKDIIINIQLFIELFKQKKIN